MKYAPQFPIYIVSKGRWKARSTSRVLEDLGVPYFIIVEPQEREHYAAVIDPAKVLTLDLSYKAKYDTFSKLREELGTGSGPARNFAWDHAATAGAEWHWCMDDNIKSFHRLNDSLKVPIADGAVFAAMEDFCLRYENICMAGPNYFSFVPRKQAVTFKPFVLNTRIYSCNLIRTGAPFRWRGRYNEDTDLSLRMLKAGWCTILFNAFLQFKNSTQILKKNGKLVMNREAGGNTETVYEGGRAMAEKAAMLIDMHPDVARITVRWNRIHHYVDYSKFAGNKLVRKTGAVPERAVNDYGMVLLPNENRRGLARTLIKYKKLTA